MALVNPVVQLTYYPPGYDGMATKLGWARDFKPGKDWEGNGEYIDPLQAIAPAGTYYPSDMTLADWDVEGPAVFRELDVSGNPPCRWIQCYDGTAYASGTWADHLSQLNAKAWGDALLPRFVLHTARCAPPANQGITPQLTVGLNATERQADGSWKPGSVALFLPLQGGDASGENVYGAALLAYVNDSDLGSGAWDILAQGTILGVGPKSTALQQGPLRESWVFEYEELWLDASGALWAEAGSGRTFQGTHFLIRRSGNMSEWWHVWDTAHRVLPGAYSSGGHPGLRISAAGAVQAFNVAYIPYGAQASYTRPALVKCLVWPPPGTTDEFNDAATFGSISSPATGWTVNTIAADVGHRPEVQFLPGGGYSSGRDRRPVLWTAYVEHPAVITPQGGTPLSTAGTNLVRAVTVKQNREWKRAAGSVRLEVSPDDNEVVPTWRENGKVKVNMGWQAGPDVITGMEAGDVDTLYIPPRGIARKREGEHLMGAPQAEVELRDFFGGPAENKDIHDVRQAAWMTVGDWTRMIGNRMGLPAALITVDAAVENRIIPGNALPSIPTHAPRDGEGWERHIGDVEKAAHILVGSFNGGIFSRDLTPPAYVPGTSAIAFTLDYHHEIEDNIVYSITAEQTRQFRNMAKIVWGPVQNRQTYYWVEPLATREAGIADDWPKVIIDEEGGNLSELAAWFVRNHYAWQQLIVWRAPLRRALQPDQFVEVYRMPGIAVAQASIWQIVHVTHGADLDLFDADDEVGAIVVG